MNEDLTVTIPESNLERLDHEIEKLNRRARKLGTPELSRVIHAVELRRDVKKERWTRAFWAGNPVVDVEAKVALIPKIKYVTVELLGEGPVIDGYQFIGTLDHFSVPGQVIVKTVPGEEIPADYWDAAPVCDHCDTQRYRKETFLFRHEDGSIKQVGRSCLRDFFGHDPKRLLRIAEWAHALAEGVRDEDGGYGSYGRADEVYELTTILELAAQVIRTHGWVSRSNARFDEVPTSGHINFALNPPSDEEGRREWRDFMASLDRRPEEDQELADGAIAWLAEQEASSEYMHNLKAVAASDGVTWRNLGLWVSLMAVYQRELDTLKRAERTNRISEYWGEVKVRAEVKVTIDSVRTLPGNDWGPTYLHKFLTEEGHTLVWFGTAGRIGEAGDELVIKATVKKHDEYNGWKQTIVTRVAVVEEE